MKNNHIPICYFPSTVMFVDDSRDFLLNFTLQLNDDISFDIHHSAFDALEALEKKHQPEQINEKVLTEYMDAEGCPMTNYTVNVNLSAIHGEVFNPQRFKEVSVVVVDYAMPGMNGLEFCQKLENSPVKRILLTGRADEKTAVQAFNDGIIDMYIPKQAPNITKQINEGIATMQFRYFQSMSDIVIRMLSVHSPNCLQDPAFINMFEEIKKEHKIIEYYLTENSGSFLLMDIDGNINYLIVKSQQDMDLHYEMAIDNKVPEMILEQLKNGEKIPYFWHSENYYQAEWSDWSTYLYPAKKLVGSETYYYAFVEKPLSADIQPSKIVSYGQYLDKVEY